MNFLEKFLEKIAKLQVKYTAIIGIILLLFTVFMIFGIPQVQIQSDFEEGMPKELPIYQLNDRVTEKFGGQDTVLILLTIDETHNFKDLPKDIRAPEIIQYISNLQESLQTEPSINSAVSVATYFQGTEINEQNINNILNTAPAANEFFSKNYKSTYIIVTSDIGSGEEKVNEINELIQDKINTFSKPPGTNIQITGNPPVRVTVSRLLISDAVFTILIACLLIFILLLILEKSLIKSTLIFIPLITGLIWTIGSLGWLGIKLSLITAGLGAIILGLGVEYGVFMLERYLEERNKKQSPAESIQKSLPGVGSAIMGSGLTTTAGFLALSASIMPMLQDLGQSLALGIAFTLLAAIIITPIIFLITEKTMKKTNKILLKKAQKLEKRDGIVE